MPPVGGLVAGPTALNHPARNCKKDARKIFYFPFLQPNKLVLPFRVSKSLNSNTNPNYMYNLKQP